MADRDFAQESYSNELNVVRLYAKLTFAADVEANGVTVTSGSAYVTSVARSAEGALTITLADTYGALLHINAVFSKADTILQYVSDAVSSAKTIAVKTTTAGSDADADSATALLEIVLRNSGQSL